MSFECFESSIERCHQESSRSYPASYQPHLEGHDTPHPCLKMMRLCISGWWLSHPSEKYEFVNGKDDIPYYEMENMKYLKPPTRYIYIYTSKSHPLISFCFFSDICPVLFKGVGVGVAYGSIFQFSGTIFVPKTWLISRNRNNLKLLLGGRWFLQPWRESRVPENAMVYPDFFSIQRRRFWCTPCLALPQFPNSSLPLCLRSGPDRLLETFQENLDMWGK